MSRAVNYAFLSSGNLLINLPNKLVEKNVSVCFDGSIRPLEEIESDSVFTFGVDKKEPIFFPHKGKLKTQSLDLCGNTIPDGASCFVNFLPAWTLDGKATFQIQIGSRDIQKSIVLGDTKEFFVSAYGAALVFKVASHRCIVNLKFDFKNESTGEKEIRSYSIDRSFIGGTNVERYQEVVVPVPFKDVKVLINCILEYQGYISDESEGDPFVFIADPSIRDESDIESTCRPRELFDVSKAHGKWMFADEIIVRSSAKPSIALIIGDEAYDLFPSLSTVVTFVSDCGHSVQIQSPKAQSCFLKIDGEVVRPISLNEGTTSIEIPKKYMRGEIVVFEIFDHSLSQILLSVQILAPKILTLHEVMSKESRSPLPTELTIRANHRFQGLRRHLHDSVQKFDLTSLNIALNALDQTYETITIKPIEFPKVEKPDVSVVIPAHNKINVTYFALCALVVAQNNCSFEIILIDDGSTDESKNLSEIVSGIKIIRNEDPQRFIRACNSGVQQAKGRYVAILNNDTEVTAGWLDELLHTFETFDQVGLVGAKLLYPDGRLQDGGGLVWKSGTPWNYGHGDNPWKPEYCYTRQVDYLSGAALLTSRKIWDEVGGLSSYLEPMYFEDTDLAFKVRQAGYKTYYVPSSIVYHFEGATSGTDITSGVKKYQAVNFPKFKRKWSKAFQYFGKEGERPDLEKDRGIVGRVLFIDYTTPREDRDAGSFAARREIELVQSLGYKVTFLPENLAHLGAYTDDLQKTGVEVIVAPFYLSILDYLQEHAADFDVVYITRYHVAQNTIAHIRTHAPHAKIILNNADLHFLRELRAGLSENNPARLDSMRSLREQELDMMKRADLVLSYNEVEHAVIMSHTDGQARVMECPWVVKIPPEGPALKSRSGLSFLGSFNHTPNGEGLKWFCAEVMPLLANTEFDLSIYGSGMKDDIKALASDMVKPVGFVEDISEAYHRHRVFVAPLLSGAGIKGKVVSALAHGIPTVLTPVAAEGIGLRNGLDCVIVEKPKDWEKAIRQLMTDTALWNRMSKAARSYAAERFSFEQGRAKMKAAFEAVDLFGLE